MTYCTKYSSCNEYVPSRDLLKVFCCILNNRHLTNEDYKNNILKSIFKSYESITYFKSNVDYDYFLIDKTTKEALSSEWIINNVFSPNEVLNKLLVLFNKNPYIITNDDVIPENNVYNFTRENFRNIVTSISNNKTHTIMNFKTKYDKEIEHDNKVASQRRKSPGKKVASHRRKSPGKKVASTRRKSR